MIEFVIPGTPPSKNEHKGSHWAEDQDVHDDWRDRAVLKINEAVPSGRDLSTPVALLILCFEETRQHRDVLNYASQGTHGIQDGVVNSGVLPDDSYKEIQGVYLQWGKAAKRAHTIVRILEFGEWVDKLGGIVQP